MPWKIPVGADLAKVLDWKAIHQANQNLGDEAGMNPALGGQLVDPTAANRRDEIVAVVVHDLRGAIQSGGRFPLSVTPNAVPPSSERHVLNLAAWQLILSTPGLVAAYMSESGVKSAWDGYVADARKHLEDLRRGLPVERPEDPTGQDYCTPVSDQNPPIRGTRWGDMQGSDLDYEAGGISTVTGSFITLPVDNMRTW